MADTASKETDVFMGYGLFVYALVSVHVCAFLFWIYSLTVKQRPEPPKTEHQD